VERVVVSEDRGSAEILWGCDDLKTGFTFHQDLPVEKLREMQKPTETPTINDNVLIDSKGKRGKKAVTA